MARLGALCVYCGSRVGADPAYGQAARRLGRALAREKVRLVYGGGGIGLMGELARTVLAEGGAVTGIIPGFLRDREVQLEEVEDLEVVATMHERKQRMFEAADAFAVLPGGIGTLEETIEVLTWAQLGAHAKPILLVNVKDYWTPLLGLITHVVAEGFASPSPHALWTVVAGAEDVIPAARAALEGRAPEPADAIMREM